MGENEEEFLEAHHAFYDIYEPMRKRYGLRSHIASDIYGNNLIEIWEYAGDRRGRCICKVKEDTETACYKRAIEILESYSGKGDHAGNEQKAEQRAG